MKTILSNEEIQMGLSGALSELKNKNRDLDKLRTHAILAGRLLSSVKLDMDAAKKTKKWLPRTKTFLGLE